MRPDDISEALNSLEDEMIEETNEVRENPKGNTSFFQKYQSLVAGIAVVLLIGTIIGTSLQLNLFDPEKTNDSDGNSGSSTSQDEGTYGSAEEASSPDSSKLELNCDSAGFTQTEDFLTDQFSFALKLFQTSAKESQYENVLISPLSMMETLAMTANGASGETMSEMEQVLAGTLSLEQLNENLQTYTKSLLCAEQYELQLANSIWIREDEGFTVKENFLTTNRTFYDAQIFTEPFTNQTVGNMNSWVNEHTNGHINEIIEEIDTDTVMYLINALAFDSEWEEIYSKDDIFTDEFTSTEGNGKIQKVEMMHSTEHLYLEDKNATGFIKNYKDGAYKFAALLPNEEISLSHYIETLTSDGLLQTIANAEKTSVAVTMPKFSYQYDLEMNPILKKMGIVTAFDSTLADFSNLGTSDNGNLYIGKVLHKTFISVDEKGTQAGAATYVEITEECAIVHPKEIILNRPFVYMILDGNTNLPIFIGTVTQISQ